jgi:hypothetical protein
MGTGKLRALGIFATRWRYQSGLEGAGRAALARLDRWRWQPVLYYHPSADTAGFLAEAQMSRGATSGSPPMPLGARSTIPTGSPGDTNRLS